MTMNTLFPDLAPPIVPKSERTRYIRQAQAIILRRALRGDVVGADDVHRLLPTPDGVDPKALGNAFYGLFKAEVISPTGKFQRSGRACRHKGVFRLWVVGDTKAARTYLAALMKSGDAEAMA